MKILVKANHCPAHGKEYDRDGNCDDCSKEDKRLKEEREAIKAQHDSFRVGKTRLQKADRPLKYDHDAGYTITKRPDGTFTEEEARAFLRRLTNDPVLFAAAAAAMRRPSGVSKERFGVAIRSSVREPMLNANPDTAAKGLDFERAQERLKRNKIATAKLYKEIVVKPKSMKNARYGRNSSFWGERRWLVHTLKYGRGYTITTDLGDQSKAFSSYGEARTAIVKSGWEIVR